MQIVNTNTINKFNITNIAKHVINFIEKMGYSAGQIKPQGNNAMGNNMMPQGMNLNMNMGMAQMKRLKEDN